MNIEEKLNTRKILNDMSKEELVEYSLLILDCYSGIVDLYSRNMKKISEEIEEFNREISMKETKLLNSRIKNRLKD